jgi:predicted phage terminase large subunit-like protein
MGVPTDASSDLVDAEWFKRYTGDPRQIETVRRIVVSVDTANKANERNDFTAILVWIESTTGNHYLADVVRERLEFPQMVKKIDDTAKRWKANVILVEDKGSGTQYIQTRQGKAPAPVIGIPVNAQSKEFRFDAVTPTIESGVVYLPEISPWLADYEREVLAFPLGKFDDQVDATSQYLSWIGNRRGKGRTAKIQTSGGMPMDARRRQVEAALEKEMIRLTALKEQDHPVGASDGSA